MKSPWIYAAFAAGLFTATVSAQDVIIRSKKDGNARTTTVIPVQPPKTPAVPGAPPANPKALVPAPGEAQGKVIDADKWICGKQFTDTDGKTWSLAYGPPASEKPNKLTGWMIRARNEKVYFLTVDGSLFAPTPTGPVARTAPKLGENLIKQINDLSKQPMKND